MKYIMIILLSAIAGGLTVYNFVLKKEIREVRVVDPSLKPDTAIIYSDSIPPPKIVYIKAEKIVRETRKDTTYIVKTIPISKGMGIDGDNFATVWEAVYLANRNLDSVLMGVEFDENAKTFVFHEQWNADHLMQVSIPYVVEKPHPFFEIKPQITLGIDVRGKPNVVAGIGVSVTFDLKNRLKKLKFW